MTDSLIASSAAQAESLVVAMHPGCFVIANEVGALWPTAWGTLLCEVCHRKRDPDPPREKKAKNSAPPA